jgi:hypothetical protein
MKPLFIFNYDKTIMKKVKAFHKVFSEEGGKIATAYKSKKSISGASAFNDENLLINDEVKKAHPLTR